MKDETRVDILMLLDEVAEQIGRTVEVVGAACDVTEVESYRRRADGVLVQVANAKTLIAHLGISDR